VVVVTPNTLPQQRRDKNGGSAWTGGVSLAKAVLGVGILVLPAIVARIGMASALIYLAFIAVLTYFSLHFLTVASARCVSFAPCQLHEHIVIVIVPSSNMRVYAGAGFCATLTWLEPIPASLAPSWWTSR
jgi:hypothetical protein